MFFTRPYEFCALFPIVPLICGIGQNNNIIVVELRGRRERNGVKCAIDDNPFGQ